MASVSRLAIAGVMALLLGAAAHAQGTSEDYERAASQAKRFRDVLTSARVDPHWITDALFWYELDHGDQGREYLVVNADTGERRPAFDHDQMAAALAAHSGGAKLAAGKLPIERLGFDADGQLIAVNAKDTPWLRWNRETQSLEEVARGEKLEPVTRRAWSPPDRPRRGRRRQGEAPRRISPDGRWEVTQRDGALVLIDREAGEDEAKNDAANEADPVEHPKAAKPAGDNRFAEMVYWAPDSSAFIAIEVSPGLGRKIQLIESSPDDQLQGKLHELNYTKPGDKIEQRWPRLFPAGAGEEIPVDRELFANPWSISRMRWEEDSSRFLFLYNQRGHQALRLVAIDAKTGDATAVINEQSETFIDYAYKQFLHPLKATGELIWMSERDGWNHLYLLDAKTGAVKRQLTRGPWVVRGVEHVDEDARTILFRCGGIYGEQDPYYQHFCRVDIDTGALTRLTDGDGDHKLRHSPDRRFVIDEYSRVDLPPVTELRRAEDGRFLCELARTDTKPLIEAGWQPPEPFVAKGRDGKTDIYGVIYRPSDFDPQKKYPVIEEHYAGPHGSHTPKAFRPSLRGQDMAELGFIVVRLDGMGTSNRSKAFHDVAHKNLADAGLPDRIAWIKAAAQHEPAMDLDRVGIRGTSAGGQTAMAALLWHGDFYKAAVSNCGCHDNRVDKIWWNELWMGWPIGPHYAEQSNVTNAHRLEGDLMLIVGEMDRNVDPVSTMQVVDALIKADKDFEMLVVPGGGHGAGPYAKRRTWDFFVRKLHGVEPRRDID